MQMLHLNKNDNVTKSQKCASDAKHSCDRNAIPDVTAL